MHSIWLVLVLSVLSSSVRAGTLGDLFYRTNGLFIPDVLFIPDSEVTITGCKQDAQGELVIPAEIEGLPVTRILKAFSGCRSLTSITIPDSVTFIGEQAFYDCSSLTSITIPDSVTFIGERAFWECSSLTSIAIPDSVTSIGDYAFMGCYELESIVVPSAFHSRAESHRIGSDATGDLWFHGRYTTHSSNTQTPTTPTIQPSIRMAPVIMVQGNEGSIKTIEVSDSPDGPWRFWMDVTATASGVAITDLDGQAHKRFYRVVD